MVEQVLPHESVVTLEGVGIHGPVFIEIERPDVLEREAFLLMTLDQFGIHTGWGGAGGQAKHARAPSRLAPTHAGDHSIRNQLVNIFCIGPNDDGDVFRSTAHVRQTTSAGNSIASLLWQKYVLA